MDYHQVLFKEKTWSRRFRLYLQVLFKTSGVQIYRCTCTKWSASHQTCRIHTYLSQVRSFSEVDWGADANKSIPSSHHPSKHLVPCVQAFRLGLIIRWPARSCFPVMQIASLWLTDSPLITIAGMVVDQVLEVGMPQDDHSHHFPPNNSPISRKVSGLVVPLVFFWEQQSHLQTHTLVTPFVNVWTRQKKHNSNGDESNLFTPGGQWVLIHSQISKSDKTSNKHQRPQKKNQTFSKTGETKQI